MNGTARLSSMLVAFPIAFGLAGGVKAGQVTLSDGAATRAGIAVARLDAAHASALLPALGSVLDPVPLIALSGQIATIEAQVAGAEAKVVLEKEQMKQASALYRQRQIVSLADYQKAAEDLAANQAILAVARSRRRSLLAQIGAGWGPAVAAILRTGADTLPQLAEATAMLVGLSLPPGATLATSPHHVEAQADGIRLRLELIGPIPKMLGDYPGQAFLYKTAAQPGIPIGTTVSASLPAGPMRAGVLVPYSAVMWQNGRTVVFRAATEDRFETVPIATDIATDDGYFVSERLTRADRVVVRGASLLLGAAKTSAGAANED